MASGHKLPYRKASAKATPKVLAKPNTVKESKRPAAKSYPAKH